MCSSNSECAEFHTHIYFQRKGETRVLHVTDHVPHVDHVLLIDDQFLISAQVCDLFQVLTFRIFPQDKIIDVRPVSKQIPGLETAVSPFVENEVTFVSSERLAQFVIIPQILKLILSHTPGRSEMYCLRQGTGPRLRHGQGHGQ